MNGMQRKAELFNGPFDGRTVTLYKESGHPWPTRMEWYYAPEKKLAAYEAKTIRKWHFKGYVEVPPEEPVVQIDFRDGRFMLLDPTGRDDWSDLPVPSPHHPDPCGFVQKLFEGGRTHVVAGPSIRGDVRQKIV